MRCYGMKGGANWLARKMVEVCFGADRRKDGFMSTSRATGTG